MARGIPGTLRTALQFKRMSYRQLAVATGLSKSTIGNLATGQVETCDPELAGRIAEALSVPPEVLFVLEVIRDSTASIGEEAA